MRIYRQNPQEKRILCPVPVDVNMPVGMRLLSGCGECPHFSYTSCGARGKNNLEKTLKNGKKYLQTF